MGQVFAAWGRWLVVWARALRATLAEPGPLETDGFRQEETVFQRTPAWKPR